MGGGESDSRSARQHPSPNGDHRLANHPDDDEIHRPFEKDFPDLEGEEGGVGYGLPSIALFSQDPQPNSKTELEGLAHPEQTDMVAATTGCLHVRTAKTKAARHEHPTTN